MPLQIPSAVCERWSGIWMMVLSLKTLAYTDVLSTVCFFRSAV